MSEQIEQQNNKVQTTAEKTTAAAEQVAGFQVVNEGFTTREAIEEAKRCLHCKVPQCKKGCPIGNDIPDFVHELSMGNMGAAMSIINAKSNLPAICGRVCPHEKQCQGNCVLGKKGKPVQIGKLEQFVADFDTKMNLSREKLPQKTRGRVAVIGSGPAGLTVAGDLARQGFNVTIFEGQAEPGGVLMSIINAKSNLPAICGRVCPHEKQCQGNCVLGKKGKPVQIGKLEQFVADFDTKMNLSREKLPQKTRGRVAVIGSGPAGLTVAGDLARQGFNVTIFEGQAEPGGVLMYGIPEYRLPKAVVRAEVSKIEALGVQFITNCMVGENNVTIDSLFRAGYDAIFMGTGTSVPQNMDSTPGAKLHGVSQSTYFLHNVNAYNEGALTRDMVPLRDGEKVGVIGGGNVAMDAARTAIRLGADVTVLYRKTQEEMPAIQSEYDEAVKEGVKFEWKTTVEAFLKGKNGRLGSCVLNTPEGERVEKFDRIYLAIGSRPANRVVSTTAGIEVDEKGYVKVVERPFGMTTRRGVFAGGDVVHRPQTVVLAMKAAKEVAQGIAQYVDAIKLLEEAKRIEKSGTTDVE